METILFTLLLISVLYIIFAQRHTNADISDIEYRMELLKNTCEQYEIRINELEIRFAEERISQRRKNTNSYRRLFEAAISKSIVYCNNGWSVSKTLLSKAKGKAYRIFEGSIRPTYLRAKQNLFRIVYRAKERQEVLSYQRAEDVYTES